MVNRVTCSEMPSFKVEIKSPQLLLLVTCWLHVGYLLQPNIPKH